jgi:hypothetical protein
MKLEHLFGFLIGSAIVLIVLLGNYIYTHRIKLFRVLYPKRYKEPTLSKIFIYPRALTPNEIKTIMSMKQKNAESNPNQIPTVKL